MTDSISLSVCGDIERPVGSGEYTAVLTRGQAEDDRVLLALEHEGAASPRRASVYGRLRTRLSPEPG